MNRPSMDTLHLPEGDKDLTDAIAEGPSPGRLWFSRLFAWILVGVAVYAVCRGAVEYPSTVDEAKQLRSAMGQADLSLTHLGSSGDRAGADWGQSVHTWRDKTAERYGVVHLHLLGCYGLLLLCPLSLVFAVMVWWRGQFPHSGKRLPLDAWQISMNAGAIVLLAGLRIFDASTLTVMGKTPPVPDLQAFLKTPTNEQKAKRLAAIRSELDKTIQKMQDKKSTPQVRAAGARGVSTAAWDRQFVASLSEADKESYRSTLKELVKKTYTEDDACPVLIRAISAFGDDEGANSLEAAREKSRPNWVDVKKPEALRCFFLAVSTGREADVSKLIERGINVNVVSPAERHTALHEAVAQRQVKVADLLIQKGAKVNIPGEYTPAKAEKEYPLHRAIGEPRLVRLLLDKGADPNAVNFQGMTPLHIAAAAGDTESAELLIGKKVKVNALDFSRRTPLDVANQATEVPQAKAMRNMLAQRGGLTSAQLRPKNSAEAAISPNAR